MREFLVLKQSSKPNNFYFFQRANVMYDECSQVSFKSTSGPQRSLHMSSLSARRLLKITRLGKQIRQLFQRFLILFCKTIYLRTINIDNRDGLLSSLASPSFISTIEQVKHTFPSCTIGTTTSLLLAPSHAMCPGYLSTSSTSWVVCVKAAVPHTPRPKAMI
jgi:hypothetical protein